MKNIDVIIIGAGAAGLMCAIEAGKRNRKVLVIDHANKPGKKILMSGGGNCNFTNYEISFDRYISNNPNFLKSALSRYTQWDFIKLVEKHNIKYHEKKHGQLFCDNKAKEIVNMLLAECEKYGVDIILNICVLNIENTNLKYSNPNGDPKNSSNAYKYLIKTTNETYKCQSLVVATGGLSIPTLGATSFGYKIAEQFNIKVWPLRAGLVPFTLNQKDKSNLQELSGISAYCNVKNKNASFNENILFTHRGLSGPAILQLSSYWESNEEILINFFPNLNLFEKLKEIKNDNPNKLIKNILSELLPKRLISTLLPINYHDLSMHQLTNQTLKTIANIFTSWSIRPNGTEGYRTAEVTLGGIDVNEISSKTMEALKAPGLFFIGEVLDVTGWLGGYNFQWAWSSGWAAGQFV